jgi:hypothetical protein
MRVKCVLFWYFLYFNQFDEGELCFIRFFLWFNRCDKVFKALVTKRFVSMLNHIWMHCSVIFRLRLYFHVLIYTIIYIFRNILWSGMVCVLPTTKLLFLNKKQSNLKRLSNIMSHIIQVLHILEKQWKVVNKICNYYTYNTVVFIYCIAKENTEVFVGKLIHMSVQRKIQKTK